MNEIGKTEPITFMVGMSPEGKVMEVVIMAFLGKIVGGK